MSRRLLPYVVLLAEVLAFHRRVVFEEGYVIPWDLRYFHLPHATFLAECFRNWTLPLWDPFTYFGRPLWANIQVQLFYPPRVASVLLSNLTGSGHLLYWLEQELILHIFLAGVFTYWLLRRLNAGEAAALAGATIYQLGGFFASQAEHIDAVEAAAWMPLAWLSIVSMRERLSKKWIAVLAFSLGMSVLSGLPAVTVTVIGSSVLLAAALNFRLAAVVTASVVWGLLLAAVQLFATTELNFHSVARYRTDWLGTGGGLPLQSLVSLVAPNYYHIFDLRQYSSPWEITFLYIYCSLGGLALALATAFSWKRKEGILFGALTLTFAFAMLGDSTPLGRAAYQLLPRAIRNGIHPEFAMPAFILGIAVLAGLGVEWFLRRPAVAYTAVAVIALDLTLAGAGRPMNTASTRIEPGITPQAFDGSEITLAKLRLLANQTRPPARTDTVNDSMQWAMAAPLVRIPSASGYDPMALSRPMQVRLAFCDGERWGAYYQVDHLDSQVLDLVNVRYLLSRTPIDDTVLEKAKFHLIADLPGRFVYENQEVLPRFFLVRRVLRAANMNEAVRLLHGPSFDPRADAIVEGPIRFESSDGPVHGRVRLVAYNTNSIELEVDTPEPAFLTTSETHYPGWRAWIDGQEQQLFYTDVAFRGLPVPAGKHTVVMEFAPSILWLGAAVSLASWIVLGVVWKTGSGKRA